MPPSILLRLWILGFLFFRFFIHNRLTEAFPIGLGVQNLIF